MRDYLKNKSIVDSIVVFLLGVALAVYSLTSFYGTRVKTEWILSPYLFSLLMSAFTVLLAISLFFEGTYEVKKNGEQCTKESHRTKLELKKVLIVTLMSIAYYILISVIHFIPASIIFLATLIYYLGEKKYPKIAVISILMPLILYVIFKLLLNVRLP